MGRIVAIGEEARIMGFALAGVVLCPADDSGRFEPRGANCEPTTPSSS